MTDNTNDKMLLIKFSNNYADEFDVEGFMVWPETKWEKHKAAAARFFAKRNTKPLPERGDPNYRRWRDEREVRVFFGTNEEIIYAGLKDYLGSFKIHELSEPEAATFTKFFGKRYVVKIGFGMLPILDEELDDENGEYWLEDENDDDDDFDYEPVDVKTSIFAKTEPLNAK